MASNKLMLLFNGTWEDEKTIKINKYVWKDEVGNLVTYDKVTKIIELVFDCNEAKKLEITTSFKLAFRVIKVDEKTWERTIFLGKDDECKKYESNLLFYPGIKVISLITDIKGDEEILKNIYENIK